MDVALVHRSSLAQCPSISTALAPAGPDWGLARGFALPSRPDLDHLLITPAAARRASAAIPFSPEGRCWVYAMPNTGPVEGDAAILAASSQVPSAANKATADAFCQ